MSTTPNPDLKSQLSDQQYRVTQLGDTEPAFSGEYWNNHDAGMYKCVVCGAQLFSSDTKFESGSGWPSFTAPTTDQSVATKPDHAHDMQRTEVICHNCGAHLGHLFEDGPQEAGGMRYCINSAALKLEKQA